MGSCETPLTSLNFAIIFQRVGMFENVFKDEFSGTVFILNIRAEFLEHIMIHDTNDYEIIQDSAFDDILLW
jgi:hypothetical protein